MKIGLIPMAAKPYHAGHDMLVRMAAVECDEVMLFVSTSDRERTGEISISGKAMEIIWKNYIENTLPPNIFVEYGGSPVGKVYAYLAKSNEDLSPHSYFIYSDDVDVEINFPNSQLTKYAPLDIQKRGISRSSTVQISGTSMRLFLQNGDVDNFAKLLPQNIQAHASEIIDILRDENLLKTTKKSILKTTKTNKKTNKVESLLRRYIRNIILH